MNLLECFKTFGVFRIFEGVLKLLAWFKYFGNDLSILRCFRLIFALWFAYWVFMWSLGCIYSWGRGGGRRRWLVHIWATVVKFADHHILIDYMILLSRKAKVPVGYIHDIFIVQSLVTINLIRFYQYTELCYSFFFKL